MKTIEKIMWLYNSHCGNRVRQKFPIFCCDNNQDETSHIHYWFSYETHYYITRYILYIVLVTTSTMGQCSVLVPAVISARDGYLDLVPVPKVAYIHYTHAYNHLAD